VARQPDAAGELDHVGRRDFLNCEGKSRVGEPGPVRGGETVQQGGDAHRPDDGKRSVAWWEKPVLPGEDQRRQVAVMIDMKMRDRDVRDRSPVVAALGEPSRDAAAAIDQQPQIVRFQQVARTAALRGQRDGSSAERGETHR
jgi:hypothetical protein